MIHSEFKIKTKLSCALRAIELEVFVKTIIISLKYFLNIIFFHKLSQLLSLLFLFYSVLSSILDMLFHLLFNSFVVVFFCFKSFLLLFVKLLPIIGNLFELVLKLALLLLHKLLLLLLLLLLSFLLRFGFLGSLVFFFLHLFLFLFEQCLFSCLKISFRLFFLPLLDISKFLLFCLLFLSFFLSLGLSGFFSCSQVSLDLLILLNNFLFFFGSKFFLLFNNCLLFKFILFESDLVRFELSATS